MKCFTCNTVAIYYLPLYSTLIKAKINLMNSKKLSHFEFEEFEITGNPRESFPSLNSHNPMNSSLQSDETFTTVLGLFNKGTIKVHIIAKIRIVVSMHGTMIALGEDNMLNCFDHTVRSTPAHRECTSTFYTYVHNNASKSRAEPTII